jgi:DNA-binding CsgD family transcriptional regulator
VRRWSRENSDVELALALASSLRPLWLARGRIREGLAWLETGLTDEDAHHANAAPAVRVRAHADKALLLAWVGSSGSTDEAEHALTTARELDDPALLIRALVARGCVIAYDREVAQRYFAEAARLAGELGDSWRLSQILGQEAAAAMPAGNPAAARVAAEEELRVADAIGDRFTSRLCRYAEGWARLWQGDLAGALAGFREVIDEATAAHDATFRVYGLRLRGFTLALLGDRGGARASAAAALEASAGLVESSEGLGYSTVGVACLASGDAVGAWHAYEAARERTGMDPQTVGAYVWSALAPLACGDPVAAGRWADDVVSAARGCCLSVALTTRARVAIAHGEMDQAERDARDALALAANTGALLGLPDTLECLADVAADAGSHREAARLLGAAHGIRQRMGAVRFKIWDAGYEAATAAVRDALGEKDFDSAWAEGAALSTDEAIAYAQRGRGQRKRPASGWAALTPAERDVVRLVSEGLTNNDVATRLFVSPRTVQTHLTHVYTKLGLTSRVQLAQEEARHG